MENNLSLAESILLKIKNNLIRTCYRPWEAATAPFCVAPKVYYVGGNDWVACYLIDTGDGLVLIDAGMQEFLYLVTESIRRLGFDPMDIKKILLSHAHIDHCGGARAIAEYTGAEIYLSREDWDFMHSHREIVFAKPFAIGDFTPDKFYGDHNPILIGNITINTLHTPGHTPGTTSFFFTVSDDKGEEYRCGMHGGLGLNTLTDKYLDKMSLPRTLQRDYYESLNRLKGMEIDITLPSHPDILEKFLEFADRGTGNFLPFVNKVIWPELMDSHIRMLEDILGHSV